MLPRENIVTAGAIDLKHFTYSEMSVQTKFWSGLV
jgi:hypothetical protein